MGAVLDFSTPHVLRNEREYDAAVAEIDDLLDRKKLTRREEERLEFLTVLVQAYDEEHVRFGEGDVSPQEVVDFMLAQRGMTRAQLAPLFGGRSRVSDFFNGKRPLSMGQVQKLRAALGISADLLIAAPAAPRGSRAARKRRWALTNGEAADPEQ
ncbi:MAG: helix-turn-helix domain-containing protein [Gemmatimonadaceae bacterium]|nr:helix-turn-helix domain-containing protein [Gemmatimonadaceae bacterium]